MEEYLRETLLPEAWERFCGQTPKDRMTTILDIVEAARDRRPVGQMAVFYGEEAKNAQADARRGAIPQTLVARTACILGHAGLPIDQYRLADLAQVAEGVREALAGTALQVIPNAVLKRQAMRIFDRTFAVTSALRLLAVAAGIYLLVMTLFGENIYHLFKG